MTGLKNVPDVEISSHEKKSLKDAATIWANGIVTANLAPSKLLKSPPLDDAIIPLPFYKGREFQCYEIPWDVIDENSVPSTFCSEFKYVFVQFVCPNCNETLLLPWVMPNFIKRIVPGMDELIDLPNYVCSRSGEIFQITKAEPTMKVEYNWGRPDDYARCKKTEIYKATAYRKSLTDIQYLGADSPNQDMLECTGFFDDCNKQGFIRLPMSRVTRITYEFRHDSAILGVVLHERVPEVKVKYLSVGGSGCVEVNTRIFISDIVALNYLMSDIIPSHEFHKRIIIPAQYDWCLIEKVDSNNEAPMELAKYKKWEAYPYPKK